MKLSTYLFALNLAPCEDYGMFDNDVKTKVSKNIGDNHEGSDLCSPFCVCQCSHISTINFKFVNVKFNISYISTQDFFYLNGIEKDFTIDIINLANAQASFISISINKGLFNF